MHVYNHVIEELETIASEIKSLLGERAAKRPVIVEFSGSPKAGKTFAISRLDLFLRRNGFNVETYTERASVAPIRKKGHVDFNTWVSCATLQGMLECPYKDLDILLVDRGIFDALVWNEWLRLTGKITPEEAEVIANFFTMDRWTQLVDLVCVMYCDPGKSIEREYADQLTTKRGTIMDENILRQLNDTIDLAVQKYGGKFKRITKIDTTQTERREGVAKVTKEALQTLREFLDESICVIPQNMINVELPKYGFVAGTDKLTAFAKAVQEEKIFLPRSRAEKDKNYLLPIPCAILRFEDKLLFLRRKEEGHPLHDTYSIWAGGHVRQSDDGQDILLNALRRELSEEVFIGEEPTFTPLGLVRTSETERASRHIGIVYEATLSSPNVALALHQKEYRETRGKSMSGRLIETNRLREYYKSMGDWSKFIVDHYWPDQKSLFSGQ